MPKKWYDNANIEKNGPILTQEELAEIEAFAQRRNDDLLEKLLQDRLFWIRSCALADSRLHTAINTGFTWFSKQEERRRSGWAKITCWADASARYMAGLPKPIDAEDAEDIAPAERSPIGFDLHAGKK